MNIRTSMNIKNILRAVGVAAALIMGISCSKTENPGGDKGYYTIETYRKDFSFNFREGSLRSLVITNADNWLAEANYSWLKVTKESDSSSDQPQSGASQEDISKEAVLVVTVLENNDEGQRKGSFDLIGIDKEGNELVRVSIPVVQNPNSGVVDGAIMFDDTKFEEFIISSFDLDGDSKLSEEEALNIKSLDLENMGFTSIEGIRYFKNLETLDANQNNLKKIDVSGLKKLKYVYFNMNKVSSFICNDCPLLQSIMARSNNLSNVNLLGMKSSLQVLDLMQNNLVSLDLSDMKLLEYVAVGKNNLTSLNVQGCEKLSMFSCNDNKLTSLNLKGLKELLTFDCSNNVIQSLSLEDCTKLGMLNVSGNTIMKSLDLTNNPIIHLTASNTNISSLQLASQKDVETLRVSDTQINSLDLAPYTALKNLECSNLSLESLDLSENHELENLECVASGLKALDLKGKTKLVNVNLKDNTISVLDLGDSQKLEKVVVKGNPSMTLTLPKSLQDSHSLQLDVASDCKIMYR